MRRKDITENPFKKFQQGVAKGFTATQKGGAIGPDAFEKGIKNFFTNTGDDNDKKKSKPTKTKNTVVTKEPVDAKNPTDKGKNAEPNAAEPAAPVKKDDFPTGISGGKFIKVKPGDTVVYTNVKGQTKDGEVTKLLNVRDKQGDLQIQLKKKSAIFAVDRDNITQVNGQNWKYKPDTDQGKTEDIQMDKAIKEGLADLAQKAEHDHEVQMARADLYKIAKYAIKLHDMLKTVSEEEGLQGWQQAKITKASDYISSVYHNLDYDMKFGEGEHIDQGMAEGKYKNDAQRKAVHASKGKKKDAYKESLQARLTKKKVSNESLLSESVQSFTDAGIPKEYAEKFLKKYQVKHDAKISPTDGVPKASDIKRDSFIINVLPNGDVRGFGKTGDNFSYNKDIYSVLHMVDGKFVDTSYESVSKAKQGMSKKGKFYTLDSNSWGIYRGKKPDDARDTRGDVMTGDGAVYKYMNDTFMKNMRPMMEKMVDDIYANLRKLDNKNKSFVSPSDQERALEAAKIIEEIAERGFNRKTMENFLTHLKRVSHGFASIPANEQELRKILKDTPNARAKWAKTILDAAKRQHKRVKDMVYKPTMDALKGDAA